jgi:deoxycytidylate deaminase
MSSNGELRMSKPCERCTQIMQNLGIKDVYYSTGDNRIFVCERVKDLISELKYKEKPRIY